MTFSKRIRFYLYNNFRQKREVTLAETSLFWHILKILLYNFDLYGVGVAGGAADLAAGHNDVVALFEREDVLRLLECLIKDDVEGAVLLAEHGGDAPAEVELTPGAPVAVCKTSGEGETAMLTLLYPEKAGVSLKAPDAVRLNGSTVTLAFGERELALDLAPYLAVLE